MNKYNVGDNVACYAEGKFDFTGEILSKNDTGEGWEYDVAGAPQLPYSCLPRVLVWESEIVQKLQEPN